MIKDMVPPMGAHTQRRTEIGQDLLIRARRA
jgi:hypothetical protein